MYNLNSCIQKQTLTLTTHTAPKYDTQIKLLFHATRIFNSITQKCNYTATATINCETRRPYSISETLELTMILETTLQNWHQPPKNCKTVYFVYSLIAALFKFLIKRHA
jgi:hypothetical protein